MDYSTTGREDVFDGTDRVPCGRCGKEYPKTMHIVHESMCKHTTVKSDDIGTITFSDDNGVVASFTLMSIVDVRNKSSMEPLRGPWLAALRKAFDQLRIGMTAVVCGTAARVPGGTMEVVTASDNYDEPVITEDGELEGEYEE